MRPLPCREPASYRFYGAYPFGYMPIDTYKKSGASRRNRTDLLLLFRQALEPTQLPRQNLVGTAGTEPATSGFSNQRSDQLSYIPI